MAEFVNVHLQKSTKEKIEKFNQLRGKASIISLNYFFYIELKAIVRWLYHGKVMVFDMATEWLPYPYTVAYPLQSLFQYFFFFISVADNIDTCLQLMRVSVHRQRSSDRWILGSCGYYFSGRGPEVCLWNSDHWETGEERTASWHQLSCVCRSSRMQDWCDI